MQTQLTKISEEMKRQANRCETIAQDKTQEALTGEPNDKARNERAAGEWMLKSQVWLEAEAIVRGWV
jgi:hypothetical protein